MNKKLIDFDHLKIIKEYIKQKTSSSGSESAHRFYQKDVTLYDTQNNPKIKIELNIAADIYDITIDGVKHKAANGRARLKSFSADVSAVKNGTKVLSSSDPYNYGAPVHSISMTVRQADKLYEIVLPFSSITDDDDVPFYIKNSTEIFFGSMSDTGNSPPYDYYQPCWPFFFVEGV